MYEKNAVANWWPYRKFWSADYWYYNNRWWPIAGNWWAPSAWRKNYIAKRAAIETKIEATPWTNQLDLIVGALPNRAGATYTPNSIWSSATQSNELGRGANALTAFNAPLEPFQMNKRWGNLNANVDDD